MLLYREAPHHIFVETGLILFIAWLFLIRGTTDPEKISKTKNELTEKEIDWLVATWEPEPLVSIIDSRKETISNSMMVIVSL